MHHDLPRPLDPTWTVQKRVLPQPLRASLHAFIEASRRIVVAVRDVGDDCPQAGPRAFAPDYLQADWLRLTSMICRISAMT